MREILDIVKIKTVEQLESVPWKRYLHDHSWLKHIKYPLSQKEMTRVCLLSEQSDKVRLRNSMGDMYFYESFQLEMKGL